MESYYEWCFNCQSLESITRSKAFEFEGKTKGFTIEVVYNTCDKCNQQVSKRISTCDPNIDLRHFLY